MVFGGVQTDSWGQGMRSFLLSCRVPAAILLVLLILGGTASASTVQVRFWSQGQPVLVDRDVPTGMDPAEAAIRALVAGPTQVEADQGIFSRIPVGVSINGLAISDGSAEVDLSNEVLVGLNESGLEAIFNQFRTTLGDFPSISAIKLTSNGELLSSYLSPAPDVSGMPSAQPQSPPIVGAVGLSGKKVAVGPSHGMLYKGWWGWQRSDPCGFGEAVLEDTNSIRLVQFLKQYLVQDGATFITPRQLDESDCCNSDTGLAWWKMCASSWLHHAGAPGSVWASSSGNTGADTATDRSSDDIRARPLWADYNAADIYIAHHTNAGGGGTANGTETFRDTAMEHPDHEANSLTLANSIQNNIIDAIRSTYDGESAWANRGVKDSAGGFGEIRIPDRPAVLIEVAFHDNCARDASYLTDDFFRSVSEWGIYKGICAYFGNTPTWDKYSCEYVSDTIPTTMLPGQSYAVSVTYRNRGVCWLNARGFRLAAVGDNNPFGTFTRVNLSGTIKPGATYTFNFTLTAPGSGGIYTAAWQMVRDGYAWFGPTVSKSCDCGPNTDFDPPSVPQNVHATGSTPSTITLAWDASTDNYAVVGYRVYRNGVQVGTAAGTSYTDSGLNYSTAYNYRVDAYDVVLNYSAQSTAVALSTSAPPFYTWSRTTTNGDCYIRSGTPDGTAAAAAVQCGWSSTASLAIRRGLVQWDVTGAPDQASIVSASNSVRVKLYCYTRSVNTAYNISLGKVTANWTEGSATWTNMNANYSGVYATTSVGAVGDYTWSWNGNTGGIPVQSRGVMVLHSQETLNTAAKIFTDKEQYGGANPRPRLEIDYYDVLAPVSCSININGGSVDTSSPDVALALSASDFPSGMGTGAQMQFSDDGTTYSAPEAYAVSKSYTLPGGEGLKIVYVKFKDVAGNWSAPVSDTITVDTSPPTGTISIESGADYAPSSSVTLDVSSTDAAQMQFNNEGGAWSGWETYDTSKIWSLSTGVGDKTVYAQFKDAAGNVSTGTISDGIEVLADTGTIQAAKALENPSEVALLNKAVTADFGDHLYIQEPGDGFSGIRVDVGGFAQGSFVNVAGVINLVNNERVIQGATVTAGTAGVMPQPLLIVNRDLAAPV